MTRFFVEGLFIPRQTLSKQSRSSQLESNIEPFARLFWAETRKEALQMANDAIEGGSWVEGPTVSETSEEKRMRETGAPELPGLFGQSLECEASKSYKDQHEKLEYWSFLFFQIFKLLEVRIAWLEMSNGQIWRNIRKKGSNHLSREQIIPPTRVIHQKARPKNHPGRTATLNKWLKKYRTNRLA